MTAIYDIASEYVDLVAAVDPIAATLMGVPGHDAEMSDYSPAAIEAQSEVRRETLAKLAAAPIENERDRIAKEAMEDVLTLREELVEAGDHYRLSGFRNSTTVMRMVFDIMPRATEDDWKNIAERMTKLPGALER